MEVQEDTRVNGSKPREDVTLDRSEERKVVLRANCGEREAMRVLIDAHKNRLFHFVVRVVRDHHDAEEVCQEAFLKAFRSLSTFNPEYRFSTWLFTIAYRLCLNGMRRRPQRTGEADFSVIPSEEPEVDQAVAQSEEAKRLKEIIWQAVDLLTPHQRATVVLFYREQHSCQEISEVLQLPVATVKSHLHRARARLRDILERQMSEDSSRSRILMELAG